MEGIEFDIIEAYTKQKFLDELNDLEIGYPVWETFSIKPLGIQTHYSVMICRPKED